MKKVAVIIARQGSQRMPGKSMSLILGKPVVWHIVDRLKKMKLFDEICIATSDRPEDASLVDLANELNVTGYAGAAEDVLDRMYNASKKCNADIVVEVGGDCPLVDKDICKRALDLLDEKNVDFVTNVEVQTFPDGLDIYAVRMSALEKSQTEARLSSHRKHPFTYIHNNPDKFKIFNFTNEVNLSHIRLTLDYQEDFELLSNIFENLYSKEDLFTFKDIMALLDAKPEIVAINQERNLPHSENAVPAYWYTKAYIKDMMNDVIDLTNKSFEAEDNNDFNELKLNFENLKKAVDELYERAKFFSKKH